MLSSHLLFSYTDSLGHTFHVNAITELIRLTSVELRIFPLVAMGSVKPYAQLAELLSDLRVRTIAGRVVEFDYTFRKGASHMLVCPSRSARRAVNFA